MLYYTMTVIDSNWILFICISLFIPKQNPLSCKRLNDDQTIIIFISTDFKGKNTISRCYFSFVSRLLLAVFGLF